MSHPRRVVHKLRLVLATAVLAVAFTPPVAAVSTAMSVAATPDCSGVTGWFLILPGTNVQWFVKTGGGWVSARNPEGLDPFGTVDLSVSGSSWHAYNPYNASFGGYTATFDGMLAANCTIGQSTPDGHWHSNHWAGPGNFLASPFNAPAVKYDVSGTVTGPDGKPVADVEIDVRNASGVVVASATTNSVGYYQTAGLAPASYSVEPAVDPEQFAPSVAHVNLVSAPATVNFKEGCPSAAATAGQANDARLRADGVAAVPACPLKVDVRVLQQIRSGLAVDDQYPSGGPVNFTVPTLGGQDGSAYAAPGDEGQKCVSGCANVLITVTDPSTGQPVEGATVTASVDPIAKLDLGALADTPNDEFLCLQADTAPGVPQSPCGTDLHDLTTDKQGDVRLIYWAPGLVDTAQTTLNVSATKHRCGAGPCTLQRGSASPTQLVVRPYLIYHHVGVLSAKDVGMLVELAQEPNLIVGELALDHVAQHLIVEALDALEVFEETAGSIAIASGLVVSTVVHAVQAFTRYGEQRGLIATLLIAEDLSTLGLSEDPYSATVPLDASSAFTIRLLDGLGNTPVPGLSKLIGPSGVLWSDAQALSDIQKRMGTAFATRPESIDLKVYEISHCDEGYAVCGPGYDHLAAQSSFGIEQRHGILAKLCLFFTGSDGFPGFKWSDQFCENQYAAPYWVVSQPNLIRALP